MQPFSYKSPMYVGVMILKENQSLYLILNPIYVGFLFETTQSITKTYNLLPELKTVNYLLKIDDELNLAKEKYIINTLLSVPQIATAYTIDQSQLKSKDNLIFN